MRPHIALNRTQRCLSPFRISLLVSLISSLFITLFAPNSALASTPSAGVLTRLVQPTYPTQIVTSRTGISGVLCALCAVSNPANVVDNSSTTKGRIYLTLGVGVSGSIAVEDTANSYPAGHFAGFVLGSGGVADIQILNKITIRTYNNGALQESKVGSSLLLNATVLQDDNQSIVGFVTTKSFDEIDVSVASLASVLVDVDVYAAVVQSAPPAPAITSPTAGSLTNDTTPTISGTAAAGNTITVKEGSTTRCTTTANSDGAWSCTPSTALGQGEHSVTATATNLAGSAASSTVSFTIDSMAPAAPTISTPAANAQINNVTPVIGGNAEANSTITAKEGSTTLCSATADSNGAWSCVPSTPLREGDHSITATATDRAGNSGPASAIHSFTVDTVAPTAPSFSSPVSGNVINDATPAINGAAEAGSSVSVKEGTITVCSATAGVSDTWSCTPSPALSEGTHTLVATATDPAGNTSAISANHSFTVDTTAPEAPSVSSPTDGGIINATLPTMVGTAEPNSTVTVTEGGASVCTATSDVDGNWSCTPSTSFATGSHTVKAKATDAAGNSSTLRTITFSIDTSAVSTPSIITPAEQAYTNLAQPLIGGAADANATVTVRENSAVLCTATAGSNGAWECESTPLSQGSHTVTATATNGIGTASSPTSRTFSVDTIAPASTPTITNPSEGARKNTQTVTFAGADAEPNSSVTVQEGTANLCVATANANGNWQCTATSPLSQGSHSVTAAASDAAGNTGPSSAQRNFSVDTVAPAAPILSSPLAGDATNDRTPEFRGTAEPDSAIVVEENGNVLCAATTDSAGNWSCSPVVPLASGPHAVTATATDASGNASVASLPRGFMIDTTAPAVPTVDSPADGETIPAGKPVFSGTAEPASFVTVTEGGNILCVATADANGSWSCTSTVALGAGDHSVTISATDAAGNTSTPLLYNFKVAAPTASMLVVLNPTEGATLEDTTPTLNGTSDPAATITIAEGNATLCTTTANTDGTWSCTIADALSIGSHAVLVTARDTAGNTSLPITRNFTIVAGTLFATITSPVNGTTINSAWPVIRGEATPESTVTLTIDPDNNPATANSVVYTTTSDAQANWHVDTRSAAPTQGKLPTSGLMPGNWASLRVTVTGSNGNTAAAAPVLVFTKTALYLPITRF